jgi:hypothetical protein
MDVVKALNSIDGPQWKTSLFGNPTDPETLRFVLSICLIRLNPFEMFRRQLHSQRQLWQSWIYVFQIMV